MPVFFGSVSTHRSSLYGGPTRKKVQRERKNYMATHPKTCIFRGFSSARALPQHATRRRLNQKHGRSVSWGSWAGNAGRGIKFTWCPCIILAHPRVPENPMDSFGSRLRHERERRQIALKSIAESTKIGITLLEGLERDDVSRWPSGIFRKSFVRSYAVAVGLDPELVLREFVERHPDPLEVDLAVPSAGARSSLTSHDTTPHVTSSPSSAGPLAIKLTITWSGSVHHTIGRLADWKIVRTLLDLSGPIRGFRFRKSLTIANLQSHNPLRIFQSAHLPILHSPSPHVSGGEAPDQAPPA